MSTETAGNPKSTKNSTITEKLETTTSVNMDAFFDQEQEFLDHAGTDADVESMKSIKISKQNAIEILKDRQF